MARVVLKNILKVYSSNEIKSSKALSTKNMSSDGEIRLGDITAVQEFNLDIADKEFVVLVGPSGCGKSTILRMVAGLESITQGELYIGNRLVNNIAAKDRNIAMVFQNYAIYPHMTVFENMSFGLRLRKTKKSEIDTKVRQAADLLGITSLLSRRPKTLSGGQRQRVAIGRAIVREPEIFLFDEPLSNLDSNLRDQMRVEFIGLRRRIEATFIYVTHDQSEAMTLGDRIIVMKDGFIQQCGTPEEVFKRPQNVFVAGFIGNPGMNFFTAALDIAEKQYVVRIQEAVFPLPEQAQKTLKSRNMYPQEIILGVRPEHILITTESAMNSIRANVGIYEMMGSEVYVHIKVSGNEAIIRLHTADIDFSNISGLKKEAIIHLAFCGNELHMFDVETENNLLYSVNPK